MYIIKIFSGRIFLIYLDFENFLGEFIQIGSIIGLRQAGLVSFLKAGAHTTEILQRSSFYLPSEVSQGRRISRTKILSS